MKYVDGQAMFLDSHTPPQVYAISALKSSFEEMFDFWPLPIYAEAILLPFKDHIIYDGILYPRTITFGGV